MKTALIIFAFVAIHLIPSKTVYIIQQERPQAYEVVHAEVSAYTSSKDETDDTPFLTASGTQTREGIIACPSRLEFGTRVEIAGEIYVCEDRMNRRYRDTEHYDIWMPSKEVAYEWGRKVLAIRIHE